MFSHGKLIKVISSRGKDYLSLFLKNLESYLRVQNIFYNLGSVKISNISYDKLENLYRLLKKDFVYPWTQNPSGDYQHSLPFGTLKKFKKLEKLWDWCKFQQAYAEPKIDGVSLSVEREHLTSPVNMLTRGDGSFGEYVNKQLPILEEALTKTRWKGILRGELYVKWRDYRKMGLSSSPRNWVAGLLNRKQFSTSNKYVRFVIFDKFNFEGEFSDHIEEISSKAIKNWQSLESVKEKLSIISLSIPVDGIVIRLDRKENLINSLLERKDIACWKLDSQVIEVEVKDIRWQVGRQGKLCPLAIIKPTKLAGSLITKLTLHNLKFLQERGIGIGSRINIVKSGLTIPKVISCKLRKEVLVPKYCPYCKDSLEQKGEGYLFCINFQCQSKSLGLLSFLFSRSNWNIQGLAKQNIIKMLGTFSLKVWLRALIFPRIFVNMMLTAGIREGLSITSGELLSKKKWNLIDLLLMANRPSISLKWSAKIANSISTEEFLLGKLDNIKQEKGLSSKVLQDLYSLKSWDNYYLLKYIWYFLNYLNI